MPTIPPSFTRVIAIDTSFPQGSVAAANPVLGGRDADLGSEGVVPVFSETFESPADHARLLAGGIERTCHAAGWRPREASLVGVVVGPGSFTGLRVGVTAAKVLAWASGCRLVGISSFDLLAHRGSGWLLERWPDTEQVHVALDAGRGEVHATAARRAPNAPSGWNVADSVLLSHEAWIASLPEAAAVISPLVHDSLIERTDLRRPPPDPQRPAAADAVLLAVRLAEAGLFADAATLTPAYLRPSYAEEPRRR